MHRTPMQKILFAFIALTAAGAGNAALMPVFFRLSEPRVASGATFDIYGLVLYLNLAMVFAVVYWVLNRAWSRWG